MLSGLVDKVSKGITCTLVIGSLLMASQPAGAAQPIVMDLGWATPLDSNYGVLTKKFEELVEKYSDGTIDVRLHCCGKIGSEDDAFRALQLGTADAYVITQNNVSPHWPLMDVFVLPYVFESTDHLLRVARGPVGQKIRSMIQKDTGVHLLTFGGPIYRDLYNSVRPIESIEDMRGLKLRVPQNRVMLATIEAFGAEPVPLAWSETPTALQTGTIDGAGNGTSVIREMKFYEFAGYLTILDHFVGFSPLFASDRFMSSLSDEQRAAVIKAADEAGDYHTQVTIENTNDIRNWLANEGGMTVTRPDRTAFKAAARKVRQTFAEERGSEFQELLGAIRAAAD